MPLQDPIGTPLNPRVPAPSTNVLLHTESVSAEAIGVSAEGMVGVATAASAAAVSVALEETTFAPEAVVPNPLPIEPVFQEGKDWCWVACMSMALTFLLKREVTQCEVIKTVREKTDIVTDAAASICSEDFEAKTHSCARERMADAWRAFNINSVNAQTGTTNHPIRPDFPTIQQEIRAERPIEVGLVWFEHGGHAILITGFSIDPNLPEAVWINDPLQDSLLGIGGGTGLLALQNLQTGFQNGTWTSTWTGISTKGVENI